MIIESRVSRRQDARPVRGRRCLSVYLAASGLPVVSKSTMQGSFRNHGVMLVAIWGLEVEKGQWMGMAIACPSGTLQLPLRAAELARYQNGCLGP